MAKQKKVRIEDLDPPILLLNLYLTQMITLVIAFVLYFFLLKQNPLNVIENVVISKVNKETLVVGLLFSVSIVTIDLILTKTVPKEWIDDGGINEKLFGSITPWHIFIISILVGFSEEILFRGVLQTLNGVFVTSILFTIIHFRYLKKWILVVETFLISIGLGYLTIYFGWFTSFVAHAAIDFILAILLQKGYLKMEN